MGPIRKGGGVRGGRSFWEPPLQNYSEAFRSPQPKSYHLASSSRKLVEMGGHFDQLKF